MAQCTQPLQQKIEPLETFETEIKHDHVELIKTIEEQFLTSSQQHNYKMKLIMAASQDAERGICRRFLSQSSHSKVDL